MREPDDLRRPAGPATDDVAPIWVLDDPADGASAQAIAVAERLGVPHLRVPLSWGWKAPFAGLVRGGSLRGLQSTGWPFSAPHGPALALSGSARSQAVALWLRANFGTRIVHFSLPRQRASQFDLLVVPRHKRPPTRPNVLSVLGEPTRLSPLSLSQARVAWAGRLSHLPRPLVTLLIGGGRFGAELQPSAAYGLARRVARMAASAGGAVLATTSRRTGEQATAALAEGLAPSMHLLYRWGEPGENPYAGMLALADAIVATGDSPTMISEACGTEAPVFLASQTDSASLRRLHTLLYRAGQARPLGDSFSPWPRTPLDEAGRVATEIRARMSVGPQAVD
jgi:mitochondrial fission protein ELM1